LSKKFFVFLEELEKYEKELPFLKQKYQNIVDTKASNKENDDCIVKFYLDPRNISEYPTLCHLAGTLLALPHGSASIERLFSQVKIVKNEKRSRLAEETLEALLMLK